MIIIFDTGDLHIRSAIIGGSLCGRDVFDQSEICQGNPIDLEDLLVGNPIDQGGLCALNSTRVDESDLCTQIGNASPGALYRFDTTRLTFDNTSLDWSYSR